MCNRRFGSTKENIIHVVPNKSCNSEAFARKDSKLTSGIWHRHTHTSPHNPSLIIILYTVNIIFEDFQFIRKIQRKKFKNSGKSRKKWSDINDYRDIVITIPNIQKRKELKW